MTDDVTDYTVPLKLKTIRAIVVSTAVITGAIYTAWHNASAKADDAMRVALRAENSVLRIECLVQQQNDYLIYKVKPSRPCDNKRQGYE